MFFGVRRRYYETTKVVTFLGYRIPAGFICDLGTVPRIARIVGLEPTTFPRSFLLHDYLYSMGNMQRLEADNLLKKGLLIEGASKLQIFLIYHSVRIFGQYYYASNN